jgi:type IV pilus assembly protein PilB
MAVKKRLGEMLVEAGIIDETQLHAALGHQRQWGGRLGQVLVEMKLASEEAIVDALAIKFGFEVARLDQLEPYAFEQAKALVPFDYATRNSIFPIAADTGVLTVAMSDPTNLSLTDELAFKSGRRVRVCIAGENAIVAALRHYFGDESPGAREAIDLDADDGSSVEPIYDPIGATSSEEMSRFYQQSPVVVPAVVATVSRGPAAPARAAAPAVPTRLATPAASAPAAKPVPRAAPPTTPALRPPAPASAPIQPPAPAPRSPAPVAAPSPVPAASPPPAAAPALATRPKPRSPGELQLEDQPTGSLPLQPETTAAILLEPAQAADEGAEELQPIPLDAEPLTPEEAAYAQGDAAYAQGDAAYGQGDATYGQGDATYGQGGDAAYGQGGDAAYQQGDAAYAQGDAPYGQGESAVPQGEVPYQAEAPYEEEWVEGQVRPRELTAEEAMILDELGRLASGDDAAPAIVRPAQLLATLIRLLIRKQLITEQELLDEILRN